MENIPFTIYSPALVGTSYRRGTSHGIEEAVLYAAALVSLKMETPGPFMGTEEGVQDYIRRFY